MCGIHSLISENSVDTEQLRRYEPVIILRFLSLSQIPSSLLRFGTTTKDSIRFLVNFLAPTLGC